jgi:chromosome segregation ATPase
MSDMDNTKIPARDIVEGRRRPYSTTIETEPAGPDSFPGEDTPHAPSAPALDQVAVRSPQAPLVPALEAKITELEDALARSRRDVEGAVAEAGAARRRVAELEQDLEEAKVKNAGLLGQVGSLGDQVDALTSRCAELKEATGRSIALERELGAARQDLYTERKKVAELESEIRRLRPLAAEARSSSAAVEDFKKELELSRQAFQQAMKERDEARAELEAEIANNAKVRQGEKEERKALEFELIKANQKLEDMQPPASERTAELIKLLARIPRLEGDLELAQGHLALEQQRAAELEALEDTLRRDRDAVLQALREAQAELEMKDRQIKGLGAQLESTRARLDEAAALRRSLQQFLG